MNGIDVRPARESDLDQIATLILEAFRMPSDPAAWLRGGGYVLTEGDAVRACLSVIELVHTFERQEV